MPRYSLKLGGKTVFSTETDEPIGESLGRRLQGGKPQTKVDSGGTAGNYKFQEQELDRDDLRKIKEIRETGGLICQLMHAKALMHFGTGVEFQTESELEDEDGRTPDEWLHDQFNDIDNLVVDLGEDALWYPFAVAELVETRGNGFSHVEMAEPWTMLPKTDRFGDVVMWEQEIRGDNSVQTFQADEIVSFVLNKSGGRDKIGISEVLRAEDEITNYKRNQEAIQQAVDQAAWRRHWWKIGREGAGIIDDNELRRVRNRLSNLEGDTQIFTGQDVDHELMDAMNPEAFKTIAEMDIRNMAVALGVPIELASVISEGLGSGEQSGVRMQAFLLAARANQRKLADQFIQEVVRPVLERYSPFPSDINVEMVFGEPLSDEMQAAQFVDTAGPHMTLNEVRERLDLPPEEDPELGESYRKPANIEAPEEEEPEDGGLPFFSDAELQLEASNAVIFSSDGDPFMDEQSLENFLDDLSRFADIVLMGDTRYPAEEFDVHEKPIKAIGIDEERARTIYEWHSGSVLELEPPTGTDVDSLFMSEKRLSDGTPEWDEPFLAMHRRTWDEDGSKNLLEFSGSQTPEMVKENIREAIMSGTLFPEIESIPSDKRMQLRNYLVEQLEDENWNIDGVADRIMDLDVGLTRDRAELIARTETAAAVNTAREDAYEERGLADDSKFYWVGTSDARTTEACEWLKEQTNPKYGGDPVTLERLRELVDEAPSHDPEMQDNLARPENLVVHPNERHTWVRAV